MRLPTYDDLIPEQRDLLDHPLNKPLFVAGPPGSGKTILAVRRGGMVADAGHTVVLVTYNRMLRRLSALLNETAARSDTMHRFLFHDYRGKTGNHPEHVGSSSYDYDFPSMLAALKGHPNADATWDHVVVDEGQDLPEGFFRYASEHGGKTLTVFADEEQALSERHTTLEQIRAAANLPKAELLTENHRNSIEIAVVASHFHGGKLPVATVRRGLLGQRPRLLHRSSIGDTAEFVANWAATRGGTIGVVVSRNATGVAVHREIQARMPTGRVDIYTSGRDNEDAIALLEDGVTVLNEKSVKGQEFDSVFILELGRFIPCSDAVMRRTMYMLCSRARDHLFLVHGPAPLSPAALATLPGEDLLERG